MTMLFKKLSNLTAQFTAEGVCHTIVSPETGAWVNLLEPSKAFELFCCAETRTLMFKKELDIAKKILREVIEEETGEEGELARCAFMGDRFDIVIDQGDWLCYLEVYPEKVVKNVVPKEDKEE
jgi:hypothetical protein